MSCQSRESEFIHSGEASPIIVILISDDDFVRISSRIFIILLISSFVGIFCHGISSNFGACQNSV